MPLTNEIVAKAILERMYNRRQRESLSEKNKFTMCYAVSVKTGVCYVGYNMQDLNRDQRATNCAETRASYVAKSYGENVADLVFFAMNANYEVFNACTACQQWLVTEARGFLKNQSQAWIISTMRLTFPDGRPSWKDKPLTQDELAILYSAGEKTISEESEKYFSEVFTG